MLIHHDSEGNSKCFQKKMLTFEYKFEFFNPLAAGTDL